MNPASMKRLDFRLPDFTRFGWVSDPARDVWQPRIQRIVACRQQLEWLSVVHGLRDCCLTLVSTTKLVDLAAQLIRHELVALPIAKQKVSSQPYATVSARPQPGDKFDYRVVVGSVKNTAVFKIAWDSGDKNTQRELLGYPICCGLFFEKIWDHEKFMDTTWPMAMNTLGFATEDCLCDIEQVTMETNVLLRWLGVRAVSHLPCSFSCHSSASLGRSFMELGRNCGFQSEVQWTDEILSWPVEWSALHGIAEIKSPIVKISTCTDATAEKYIVRYHGRVYPELGAQGLTFPYRPPDHTRVTGSNSFRRGLEHPIQLIEKTV